MVCMFTGHRKINGALVSQISNRLDSLLEELIAKGYTEFCAGGAVGFDTIAALKVIEKKKKYGFVRLHMYLPCQAQERRWSDTLKAAYYYALENADTVRYSCDSYVSGCMQKRNREMVDASDLCVAYCGTSSGGTFYTVCYAEKKGIEVINLFEETVAQDV